MSFLQGTRIILVSACTCILASTLWADQIVLKNGDRVTGSIVKKDGKSLTVKTDHFGVVTTDWDQVATITADKTVNVVLKDGKTAKGTLATANGQVEIVGANLTVAPADITTIRDAGEQTAYERLLKPTFGQLWTGTGSLGLAGTKGNADTLTFTTGIAASRTTNTDKTAVYFNVIKASSAVNGVSSDTAQAVHGGLSYNHNLASRIFANVFNDYQYDKFQDLNLRVIFGGGIGFHAVKAKRHQLDMVAGADYNHASFSGTPTLIQSSAEFYFGDDYNLKLTGSTALVQSFRFFDGGGAHRINFDVGASTKISKWLNWNLSLSERYVSDPAPTKKNNDFLYTTGLGITFGK